MRIGLKMKPVQVLRQHLYIEPTTVCNLHCKMCYTNVINGSNRKVIPRDVVLDFTERFVEATEPPVSIYWCGTGEVFLHPHFPEIVNRLMEYGDGVEQTIQTNGTTPRRLDEFTSLAPLRFRVSIDGYREFHEWHRGKGNYDRSIQFCRKAVEMGCRSLEVRCLLTRGNIDHLDEFFADIKARIGQDTSISLFTIFNNRNISEARELSPLINPKEIDDSHGLSDDEARLMLQEKYGDRYRILGEDDAVENYVSLNPYGVYTCCNGIVKIGEPDTDVRTIVDRMIESESDCKSCALFPCQ